MHSWQKEISAKRNNRDIYYCIIMNEFKVVQYVVCNTIYSGEECCYSCSFIHNNHHIEGSLWDKRRLQKITLISCQVNRNSMVLTCKKNLQKDFLFNTPLFLGLIEWAYMNSGSNRRSVFLILVIVHLDY